MAYTYLSITNEVLARMNEVNLTSSNFSSARGFQIQCKNAVNDSINFINHDVFQWPFNHETHTETLVAGTTRYSVPTTTKTVDYHSFRLVKDSSLGTEGGALRQMDYKEYMDRYVTQEDDATVMGGIPKHIVRTPDNNYLLYPYPNAAYSLKYEYYSQPTVLVAATDVPGIPEAYRQVIADGAASYGFQYRGEVELFQTNWARFQSGIANMRAILVNQYPYARSTVLNRNSGAVVFPSIS